ncbi:MULTISPECIES: response regulator [Pseudomonas]|uniref:Transcriptional regulator n=1 Tax=Pseudomonas oryzihabitans TaxID=47885 RepID=A0A178L9F6_9PSED|nr:MULTISPECIES: response regulator [Pseudomonas]MDC7832235.1 response regulator [Pseudomonas benzopyrenica]OAN26227.1 transcriptional regulator [Pseudomonas oryzihabitans]
MLPLQILVVDDEPLLLLLLSEIVSDMGATAVTADRADHGLSYLEQHAGEIALVVTDVMMPGRLNGFDLAQIVADRWPALPVVLTSGYSGTEHHSLAPNAAFIAKPWTYQQIEEVIRERLSAA